MPNNVIDLGQPPQSLNDLIDVTCPSPLLGNELCYDGTTWVCQPKSNVDHSITEHTDVTVVSPANNDTLCFNSATGQWENVPKANQAQSLNEHTDVVLTAPAADQVLCFDGTNWVNVPKENQDQSLDEHTDVTLTTPADNDTLCFDSASGQWVNVPKATGIPAHSINDHTDVTITSVTDGQVLCYDAATSQWINVDKENQPQSLDEHTDVTITTPADGETLCYNSTTSQWENVPKETNKCCLPDPGGLSLLDPVYIDPVTGAVTPSDLSNNDTVAQFVVVEIANGEVCIQDFGVVDLGAAHGFPTGTCVFEDVAGGSTTTEPTTGINNVLFHAIGPNKVSVTAGTRPYQFASTTLSTQAQKSLAKKKRILEDLLNDESVLDALIEQYRNLKGA